MSPPHPLLRRQIPLLPVNFALILLLLLHRNQTTLRLHLPRLLNKLRCNNPLQTSMLILIQVPQPLSQTQLRLFADFLRRDPGLCFRTVWFGMLEDVGDGVAGERGVMDYFAVVGVCVLRLVSWVLVWLWLGMIPCSH